MGGLWVPPRLDASGSSVLEPNLEKVLFQSWINLRVFDDTKDGLGGHLYFALGQVCVRGQALSQRDVRVGSHSEGLLQLGELSSAEDGPLPLPLTLQHPGGSVRLRGGQRALTADTLVQEREKRENEVKTGLFTTINDVF